MLFALKTAPFAPLPPNVKPVLKVTIPLIMEAHAVLAPLTASTAQHKVSAFNAIPLTPPAEMAVLLALLVNILMEQLTARFAPTIAQYA